MLTPGESDAGAGLFGMVLNCVLSIALTVMTFVGTTDTEEFMDVLSPVDFQDAAVNTPLQSEACQKYVEAKRRVHFERKPGDLSVEVIEVEDVYGSAKWRAERETSAVEFANLRAGGLGGLLTAFTSCILIDKALAL